MNGGSIGGSIFHVVKLAVVFSVVVGAKSQWKTKGRIPKKSVLEYNKNENPVQPEEEDEY